MNITKRTFLLFNLLLFASIGWSQSIKMVENEYEIKKFAFGEDISKFPEFALKEKFGDLHIYTNPKDVMKIKNFPIKSIKYCFRKEKLSQVIIETPHSVSSDGILSVLQEKYGEGTRSLESSNAFKWNIEDTTISYQKNAFTGKAIITVNNKIMNYL